MAVYLRPYGTYIVTAIFEHDVIITVYTLLLEDSAFLCTALLYEITYTHSLYSSTSTYTVRIHTARALCFFAYPCVHCHACARAWHTVAICGNCVCKYYVCTVCMYYFQIHTYVLTVHTYEWVSPPSRSFLCVFVCYVSCT